MIFSRGLVAYRSWYQRINNVYKDATRADAPHEIEYCRSKENLYNMVVVWYFKVSHTNMSIKYRSKPCFGEKGQTSDFIMKNIGSKNLFSR